MNLSISGIPIPIIEVTAFKNLGKLLQKREGIVITSRVHPGETNSSFVFEGMLDFITKLYD
jgi:hypothetical protein